MKKIKKAKTKHNIAKTYSLRVFQMELDMELDTELNANRKKRRSQFQVDLEHS